MKELNKQDIIDLLYGCTVLGTGGGGPLAEGLRLMESHFEANETLKVISLDELPDDEYVATPYCCGAPAAFGKDDSKFAHLKPAAKEPAILAMEALEEHLGRPFYAIGSTELGGANTAEALHAAMKMNLPLLDADPAGRSVPELQHSTYFVKDVPIFPMGVATKFGEKIVIQNVGDDFRAEDIVRAIAVVSDNMVGVADHANVGKVIKESLIPDAITYALEIGQTLRKAREAGNDVAQAIADDKDGKVLFRGVVSDFPWELRDGFNFGEIHLDGEGDFAGDKYKIWLKNENIISYRNGEVDVMAPDLICMFDENGEPLTSPDFGKGQKMVVIALPAPEVWTTPKGLECFGPKHFGFDLDYVPFTK
ncbi:MAG: DUF917 domain-containing protein [Anaerovoracaceae bacterium]